MVSRNIKALALFVIAASFTVASLSVAGLLQSTERLGATGIIIKALENPLVDVGGGGLPSYYPPPPEPEIEIDVYRDADCTNKLSSISWGEIEAGSSTSVKLYVKNNGDTGVYLSLASENWAPSSCSSYSSLSWNYNGKPLNSGEVREITITLMIDSGCPTISSFSFDLVIVGS